MEEKAPPPPTSMVVTMSKWPRFRKVCSLVRMGSTLDWPVTESITVERRTRGFAIASTAGQGPSSSNQRRGIIRTRCHGDARPVHLEDVAERRAPAVGVLGNAARERSRQQRRPRRRVTDLADCARGRLRHRLARHLASSETPRGDLMARRRAEGRRAATHPIHLPRTRRCRASGMPARERAILCFEGLKRRRRAPGTRGSVRAGGRLVTLPRRTPWRS